MFFKIKPPNTDIYGISGQFVFEGYRLAMKLPGEEKFEMVTQIRGASPFNSFKYRRRCPSRKLEREKEGVMKSHEDLLLKLMSQMI